MKSTFVSPLRILRYLTCSALTAAFAGAAPAEAASAAAAPEKSPAPAEQHPAFPPVGHVRVQWMHDPSEKALVAWTTPVAGTVHTVHYDTKPRNRQLSAYAQKQDALPSRQYTLLPVEAGTPEGWAQAALLEKLEPSTTYYFVAVSDKTVSREFHFVTAPTDDRPIKLLYGADSRRARPNLPEPHLKRREVNRLIAALVEEQPEILALAHGGDYCSYAEWRFLSDWLSDHDLTITKAGRVLPIIPARGNHEGKIGFEEVFYWPGRETPYYYSTALSPRAVLLTLNTNASKAGDQRDWLEAELTRQRREGEKAIIVQYHVPAYPSVKPIANGTQQRLHWVPLFERFQVSLVCEADDHMLKRTVPIFEDRHDPERGLIYIGDGGLGVPQRVPDLTRWYLKSPGFARPALHVHLLDFGENELRVSAIGLQRDVLDRFVVKSKVPAMAGGR